MKSAYIVCTLPLYSFLAVYRRPLSRKSFFNSIVEISKVLLNLNDPVPCTNERSDVQIKLTLLEREWCSFVYRTPGTLSQEVSYCFDKLGDGK